MSIDVNSEFYRKAMHKTQSNKQRAITAARLEKEQILQKVPELEQLASQRNLLGVKATRLSILGEDSSKIDEIFDEMSELQQKEQELLQSHGYTQNSLQPQFSCETCSDTGMVNGKMCECVHKLVREMRKEGIEKTSPLKLCSFSTFKLDKYPNTSNCTGAEGINAREHMADVLNYCTQYAANFTMQNKSIYMCGYAGLGKTHLALSIAQCAIEEGYNVVYVSAQQAFDKAEKEHFNFNEGGGTLQTMIDADLLVLDDLGTEYISPYISACLYNLINSRCGKKPTIYTSNIVNDDDLRRRYTEKIVSRLLGSCDVLTFCGEDIRLGEQN